jgi:hypothetical protein
MKLRSSKFYHKIGQDEIMQPIAFCPYCLVLLVPKKEEKGGRPILNYEHRHKIQWIYLIQKRDGQKTYRYPTKHTTLRNIIEFAGMGWKLFDWTVLQVAHYINICLKARREGKKIDALAVLFVDSAEPSENEKVEILKALGLEGGMMA